MSSKTFEDLGLREEILKALEEMSFTTPSEIQEKAIPILNETQMDFIGQAQTGTGKTAAFSLPILNKIDLKDKNVQALILTPTRELAFQVDAEIKKMSRHLKIRTACVYGGTSYEKQIKALKKDNPAIVVGTPGRVIDLIDKGILKLSKAKFCVLDEADEMLNMGFLEDVQIILDIFNENRQLVMFSATMPKPILKMVEKSFREYEMVSIKKKTLSAENIEQKYFIVRDKHTKEALARLIDANPDMYGIVFCKTRLETKTVADDLKKRGHNVEVLNGDMGQAERDHAMRNFKEKKATIMVCTDVAARGIDVNNLTHVINYGLPQDNESYVHRIGRTGRAGEKGIALTIVTPNMAFAIRKIERLIKSEIKLEKLPNVRELKRRVVSNEIDNAKVIIEAIRKKGDDYKMDATFEEFEENFSDLSKDELLKLVFTWKFNKTIRAYNNLSDIEHVPNDGRRDRGERKRGNFRKRGTREAANRRSPRRSNDRRSDGRRRSNRSGRSSARV